ncbi:MAG: DNA repair protein RadC [Planctomycetota bacterium]
MNDAQHSQDLWPSELKPRERLLSHGEAALSCHELLTLLLGSGSARASAGDLARRLLVLGGGLRGLARRSLSELLALEGIGPAQASRLAAAFEMGRRLATEVPGRGRTLRSGRDIFGLLAPKVRDLRKEVFIVLLLDGKNRLLREERVSEGSLTSSIVHPREVFAPAIRESAAAIIVAHNHPSGDPSPSREDLEVTARLVEAGRLIGITVLDHVILGDPEFVSLRERGFLD